MARGDGRVGTCFEAGRTMKRVAVLVIGASVLSLVTVTSTASCVRDGCASASGKYRVKLTLSAGRCAPALETILDTEASADSDGCAKRIKRDEGVSSCRAEISATCPDGRSYVDVMTCEDDGEKCGGVFDMSFPDGTRCIYDYVATRL